MKEMDKEALKAILLKQFSSVYCDTCGSEGTEKHCEDCHRKAMNWSMSDMCAESLAEKIIRSVTGGLL